MKLDPWKCQRDGSSLHQMPSVVLVHCDAQTVTRRSLWKDYFPKP